jgi:protein-tyrosine-phosphatase
MTQNPLIVFVCEHGAAKSVLAAAYFNRLAAQASLSLHAVARGTNPDREFSAQAIRGLSQDSLSPAEAAPQQLTAADLQTAQRVIAFCDLPAGAHQKAVVERWDDVPPVSENYEKARDAILERIRPLLKGSGTLR